MGFFERLSNTLRANLNALIEKAEDKGKLKEQALLDLAHCQKKAQALLISSMGAKKLVQIKIEAFEQETKNLMAEAEGLLEAHNEEEAKNILEKKQHVDEEKARLTEELAEYSQTIDTINHGLSALDQKISLLKTSPSESDALSDTSAFDTFKRMEEKIDTKEAEVEALFELLKEEEGPKASRTTAPHSHQSTLTLEEELDALKKKMTR